MVDESEKPKQSDPSQSAVITPDHLLALLDREIEENEAESKRPGWSVWAILSAMAGALWMLSSEVQQASQGHQIKWLDVALLGLLATLGYDGLKWIYEFLQDNPGADSADGRFVSLRLVGGNSRVYRLLLVARYFAVLLVGMWCSPELSQWARLCIYVYYSFGTFRHALMFVGAFSKIIIPNKPQQGSRTKIGLAVTWGIGSIGLVTIGAGLYGVVVAVAQRGSLLSISEVRIAFLVVVACQLGIALSKVHVPSPLVPRLREIRRKFVLGRLDVLIASQNTEIALIGLKLSDVLQEDIALVLRLHSQICEEHQIVANGSKELCSLLRDRTQLHDQGTLKGLSKSIRERLEGAIRMHDRSAAVVKRLARRGKTLAMFAPASRQDFENVLDQIIASQKPVSQAVVASGQEVNRLSAVLDELWPEKPEKKRGQGEEKIA